MLKGIARSAGGNWDADVQLWYIRYGNIKGTELEKYIILDAGMKQRGTREPLILYTAWQPILDTGI